MLAMIYMAWYAGLMLIDIPLTSLQQKEHLYENASVAH